MEDTELFEKILKLKAPWFITKVEMKEKQRRIDIYIDHEKNIDVKCPECNRFYSVYDHSPERVYRHLNVCQMAVYIRVRLPRVDCPTHGVKQILSDFGENGSDMTYEYETFIIDLAKECTPEAIGRLLNISWDRCWNAMDRAVKRGQLRKPHEIPKHRGVDEKSIAKGHKYELIVTNQDTGTVEYVCDDRDQKSLESYYQQFKPEELAEVQSVAMDMWDPFIAATKAYIPDAEHKIVFDRFHVMRYMLDAVDKTRKNEHQQLSENGDETLKGSKYIWLWNEENVPEWRKEEYEALRTLDLKTCKACAIKDNLRHLWDYSYESCMRKYFNKWYFWATHSRIEPVKKAAKTIKSHIDNIVTYAKHQVTNALGESMNAKIEKVKRMACGFRNRAHYRLSIYFHCGGLNLYPYPPVKSGLRFKTP